MADVGRIPLDALDVRQGDLPMPSQPLGHPGKLFLQSTAYWARAPYEQNWTEDAEQLPPGGK